MITGGTGSTNTLTGLIFGGIVKLKTFLNQHPGYKVDGSHVFYFEEEVGQILRSTSSIRSSLNHAGLTGVTVYLHNNL